MYSPAGRYLCQRQPWKNSGPAVSLVLCNRTVREVRVEQHRNMAKSVDEKFQLPQRYQGSTPSVWYVYYYIYDTYIIYTFLNDSDLSRF